MRALLFLLATCGILPAVTSRQVVVTPDELTGYGDFDGNGSLDAIVVERATGLYRVAFQQGDGSLQWAEARPSGLPMVDALTCGPVRNANQDAVVLSGRLANQMVLVQPSFSPASSTTEQLLPSGIGPASVAALELPVPGNNPNLMDLVVHTSENNSPNEDQRHLFRSLSGNTTESLTLNLSVRVERGTRFRHLNSGSDRYAAILRGPNERLRVYNSTTTSLPIMQTLFLQQGSEYLSGTFSGNSLNHILIYVPGESDLKVSLSNGSSLSTQATHPLEKPIASIHPMGSKNFFVVFEGGLQGRLYELSASGAPVPGQKLGAPANSRLTGVVGFDDSKMSLLAGPEAGGAANLALDFSWNGSKWQQTGVTPLPSSGSQVALTNVLLYDGEPLVDATAKLIETIQVPDWTSGLTITPGGNVMLTPESFVSETTGLNAGGSVTINPNSSPTHVFGNQNESAVSLLSLQTFVGLLPPQVAVSPLPGKYTTQVSPVLSSPDPATSLFYRFLGETDWQTATAESPIAPLGDTLSPFTLEYYATNSTGGRSPIYRAAYSYYGEPGSIDSDGDQVPDFVEIANGLDPEGGKDQDLDAVDDLYELLLGTDPTDAASKPSLPLSLNLQNVFDLAVSPEAFTDQSTLARAYPDGAAEPPADLYLHSLDGTLLGHEVTRTISGYPHPTALFEKVPATDRDLFVIVSTSATFPIQPVVTSAQGRELVALIPVPHQSVGDFDYTYDGVSTTADAAADWLAVAQTHYLGLNRPLVLENLTPIDNLAFLLTERLFQVYLRRRDATLPESPLSLTAFRDPLVPTPRSEAVAGHPFSVVPEDLLSLQDWISSSNPGHLLHDLHASVLQTIASSSTPEMSAMIKLASEVAYLSDFNDPNTAPGLYPNPFDTLRDIVSQLETKNGLVDGVIALPGVENNVGYAQRVSLTPAEFAAADSLLIQLLANMPERPTTNLVLEVGADSFMEDQTPLLFDSAGTPYELFRSDGTPYLFQEALPVGAELTVRAFTDRQHLPAALGTPLDVISAELTLVPRPAFSDENSNALDDEWELFFFDGEGDPFADTDGDGYSNLQELLEDTNPKLASSFPSGEALPLAPPGIAISQLPNGNLELTTEFPSLYSEAICFTLLTQTDLALAFQKVPGEAATDTGTDLYRLELPLPSEEKQFFRFQLELK